MLDHGMLHITTPFGRRPLTAAQVKAQAIADGCLRDTTVEKWAVLRDITEARTQLGLSAPSLAVLDALATFLPETALQMGEGPALVVFPSNRSLVIRTRGMGEATIRRHLAALVDAGIIIRRDSPNGKRYCRRGPAGTIAQAYGFDLSPLVARAAEFASLAEAVRAEALACRIARERVTLLRRDCVKLIEALEEAEGAPGAAMSLRARYGAAMGALPRVPSRSALNAAGEVLAALATDVGKLLLAHQESVESSGNAGRNERHIQDSKPEPSGYEQAFDVKKKDASAPDPQTMPLVAVDAADGGNEPSHLPVRSTYPLGLVLSACPDIRDYARGGIGTWRDLVDTAGLVRSMLGINPNAWDEAREVMGDDAAAVTIAAILQRAEHIKTPGGYLRALVARTKRGEFSLGPVLQALSRRQLGQRASDIPHRRP
ncbi:plasmid replication protein RepC [Methylobacterium tarhaniae]|uniref:plasmid replication protein RepC n=1 Tax=Methylobacterium tarhaniae TaxID=1187852 RepID=UPI003D059004